ncbi:MAG: helix-turn-helix transcriptional regulator [Candidatus Omnitrophota bacterium]
MVVYLKKEILEEILARKNLSHEAFAKLIGIDRAYLSTLKDPEKYGFSPSPDLRERMLKALDIEFDTLFFIHNGQFGDNNKEMRSDGQPNHKN